MRTYNTVATEARAEKLVLDKANELRKPFQTIFTQWSVCRCECGETSLFQAEISQNGEVINVVECAVCEQCGCDSHLEYVVLTIR